MGCYGGAFYGRYDESYSLVAGNFRQRLALLTSKEPKWGHQEFKELWEYCKRESSLEEDDIMIEPGHFISMLTNCLEESGGERLPGNVVNEDWPGQSSSHVLLYSEQPNAVIEKALSILNGCLAI